MRFFGRSAIPDTVVCEHGMDFVGNGIDDGFEEVCEGRAAPPVYGFNLRASRMRVAWQRLNVRVIAGMFPLVGAEAEGRPPSLTTKM